MKDTYTILDTRDPVKGLTIEDLLNTYDHFRNLNPRTPRAVKMHPTVYLKLKAELEKKEAELTLNDIKRPKVENYMYALYGMVVKVDPDLAPGEWKFETEDRPIRYTSAAKLGDSLILANGIDPIAKLDLTSDAMAAVEKMICEKRIPTEKDLDHIANSCHRDLTGHPPNSQGNIND